MCYHNVNKHSQPDRIIDTTGFLKHFEYLQSNKILAPYFATKCGKHLSFANIGFQTFNHLNELVHFHDSISIFIRGFKQHLEFVFGIFHRFAPQINAFLTRLYQSQNKNKPKQMKHGAVLTSIQSSNGTRPFVDIFTMTGNKNSEGSIPKPNFEAKADAVATSTNSSGTIGCCSDALRSILSRI